jgi:hypothetical protein
MGYSPDSLQRLFDLVKAEIPSVLLGGIYGTKPGYHNCRANLPSSDYSVQRPDDKLGDPQSGGAIDLTFPDNADQRLLTRRMVDAIKRGDKRMWVLREFGSTLDGVNVYALDVRDSWPPGDLRQVVFDKTHLWHIHLSFYRKTVTEERATRGVAEVLLGQEPGEDDMSPEETEKLIAQALRAYHLGGDAGPFTETKYPNWLNDEGSGVGDRLRRLEKDDAPPIRRQHPNPKPKR